MILRKCCGKGSLEDQFSQSVREQIELVESKVLFQHLNITVKTRWNIPHKFRIRKDSNQCGITLQNYNNSKINCYNK